MSEIAISTEPLPGGQVPVETFETSRLLDFFSEKELTNQVGHGKADWPLVVVKELLDNAIDACEEAGVPPEITVVVDNGGITVADNGPGIPAETVAGTLDFSKRVSSREAYVSPTRGAQGNALKTIVAMPYVLGDDRGRVDVTAHGQRTEITVSADHIRQEPRVDTNVVSAPESDSGTVVNVWWPDSASSILDTANDRILQLADDYLFLNPHLTLTIDVFGHRVRTEATNSDWKKWLPCDPSPVHWYDLERFERLIAACIAKDQQNGIDRSVREFMKTFKGLSGTAKQKAVLKATGLERTNLSTLADADGFDHGQISTLLEQMKANSRPVKPQALGIIGKDHLEARFSEHCKMKTFKHRKIVDVDDNGIPAVVETAFAVRAKANKDKDGARAKERVVVPAKLGRRLITGVNWSPGIGNPFRRLGGSHANGLDALLEQQLVQEDHPVILFVHCACPRVHYTDRGKTNITLD